MMIRHPLLFETNGKYEPGYVFDLTGRLILRDTSGSSRSFIPFAVSAVSFKQNGGYIYDTYDVELIKSDIIRFSSGDLWGSRLMKSAYPNGCIEQSNHVYVPRTPNVPKVNALELIDSYEHLGEINEKSNNIEISLNNMGIYKIPRFDKFNAAYHQAKDGWVAGQSIRTIFDGWMTDSEIIRKALVGTTQE